MATLRIALAQINTTVGDLEGNARKIVDYIERARKVKADIVVFPELAVTGYPPEDLLLKPSFVKANLRALDKIIEAAKGITAVTGFVDLEDDIYNAAAIIHDGKLIYKHRKVHLPNYGVFDELRYFQPGSERSVFSINGAVIGVTICEDIWQPGDPVEAQALDGGAELIINISASPYHAGKGKDRARMLATRAVDYRAKIAYCNLVGGQDELVFDGQSFIFNQRGEIEAEGEQFEEALVVADVDIDGVFGARLQDPRRRLAKVMEGRDSRCLKRYDLPALKKAEAKLATLPAPEVRPELSRAEEVYRALLLGTGDYVHKNGFNAVVIGLSGGVDSSLMATVAADTLGAENVTGVFMPSPFSSVASREDAEALAANLGMRLLTIPITNLFEKFKAELAEAFAGREADVTEENVQARIRGILLMALSNKFGWLVLSTGNKSEMSMGYCTLYGDMVGGFSVLKDVPKTLVYKLARFRNSLSDEAVIPERVLTKAATAELRAGQLDTDSLPPYEVLDPILKAYVEEDRSFEEMVELGFDPDVVRRVIRTVDRNEYKRRQAPPGVKITSRAFGKDRRLPITNHYPGF
ncbi:MAG: NAD+ synthase [Actinobacteria bacterium]|nr:NAD+ synthase [Actinomycetota bacterium]